MKNNYMLSIFIVFICCLGYGQSSHNIQIDPRGYVATLEMTTAEYSSWIANYDYTDQTKRQNLITDIYQTFVDDFDFIILILNEDNVPSSIPDFGRLYSVSNATTGLGFTPYDNTANYGSAGKLKSVIQLTRRDFLYLGPSLHEIMHTWANFGPNTQFGTHWGFTGGNTKGQLGGFEQASLVDNGGNNYTVDDFGLTANVANRVPYSELELYLMGMIPASSVNNFDIFTGVSNPDYSVSGKISFDATTRTNFTSATDIENAFGGARNPSSATSQKDFKALVVLIHEENTLNGNTEIDVVDGDAKWLSLPAADADVRYNFWEATQGLGTLELGNIGNSVLNTKQVNDTEFTIFPNPTSIDNLDIQGKNLEKIEFFDILGKQMLQKPLNPSEQNHKINIADLASGYYFVKATNTSGSLSTKKLIVK